MPGAHIGLGPRQQASPKVDAEKGHKDTPLTAMGHWDAGEQDGPQREQSATTDTSGARGVVAKGQSRLARHSRQEQPVARAAERGKHQLQSWFPRLLGSSLLDLLTFRPSGYRMISAFVPARPYGLLRPPGHGCMQPALATFLSLSRLALLCKPTWSFLTLATRLGCPLKAALGHMLPPSSPAGGLRVSTG